MIRFISTLGLTLSLFFIAPPAQAHVHYDPCPDCAPSDPSPAPRPRPEPSEGNPCVTRREYRRVERADTIARVHRIFDTDGRQTGRYGSGARRDVFRTYRVCARWSRSRYSSVDINFDNYTFRGRRFKVYAKSATIL